MEYKLVFLVLSLTIGLTACQNDPSFPFCIWGINYISNPNGEFDTLTAPAQCQSTCLAIPTTHFGLLKSEANLVKCMCGSFQNNHHYEEYCVLNCGPDGAYECGGPEVYMSVYGVCDPHDFYGVTCDVPCKENCALGCDINTGDCIYGCDPGWQDYQCSTPCPSENCYTCDFDICDCHDMYYGDQCEFTCPPNCNRTCEEGSLGVPSCFSCKDGNWGPQCDIPCPQNCQRCTFDTGDCLQCDPGFYGSQCTSPCPQNCLDLECSINNGDCFACNPGWYDPKCQSACPPNCNNSLCDFISGNCLECSPGWYGPTCDNTTGIFIKDKVDDMNHSREEEEEVVASNSVPAWTIGVMVALFVIGSLLGGMITYCTCVQSNKRKKQPEVKPYQHPFAYTNQAVTEKA